ncbi:SpoIIE family protein phosphatase [Allokutzneria sp. A3M-2-11 16]|uniref:SpoIIE family protein phosphatase n=1 Tax=Allokutzneria sp. A3M-2-11 16 TaxID=2962043 RepID=UPI0020B7DFE6|nr:SpoIIE family protein phosphatase [Allokutzneria sp. A3M-2-11 16]MCP3801956.1 SpoIIE family protein phosphatase [Allokutzneria sp. A3M-2-11 16]
MAVPVTGVHDPAEGSTMPGIDQRTPLPALLAPRRDPDALAPGAAEPGQGLTRLAATVDRLRREVRLAHAAADGRALVELAKGILVERLHCGPADAARQLDALAGDAGMPVLELAADIVNQAAQDKMAGTARAFLARAQSAPGGQPSESVRMRTTESAVLAAGDTQTVAQSLLVHALAPLGAVAVAIWEANADSSLALAGCAGLAAEEAQRWHYVPPGVGVPARRALTERALVWLEDLAATGLPSIGGHDLPAGARAVIPAGTGGRILGVLEICWPHPRPAPPERVQRQLEALSQLCAHTLETRPSGVWDRSATAESGELAELADSLLDSALLLRPHLDAAGELVDFRIHHANRNFTDLLARKREQVSGALFLEVYPMSAGAGGLFDKIEHVHATGEPFRASHVVLPAVVDQVTLTAMAEVSISRHGEHVLLVWRIQDETARLANLLQHAQRLGRIGGFEENILTSVITWNSQLFTLHGLPETAAPIPLEQLAVHAHPDDTRAITRFLRTLLHQHRPASTAFRLRRPDGILRHVRVIAEPLLDSDGLLVAVRGAYQDISAQHWTEVALSATRDQLAHTEQQAAESNRLALQLQQAIMPPSHTPIDTPGLRIAVRYQPAETDYVVGGDWYDAITLPTGEILLSVGDITGHGIQAATGMVVLRNALRGLAATGAGPAQLLGWLNLVARHLTDRIHATALCGLYDPATRLLRWARAGHLPPVLIRDGHADTLPMITGRLLGVFADNTYDEGQVQLHAHDVLLLYTDGLIERRGHPLDDCLTHLLTQAAAHADNLEQRVDHLLAHSASDTDDDTCLIGIELT